MKALKCDRCGKYFDEPDNENKPRMLSLGERAEYDGALIGHVVTEPCEVDLCDDCYNSLKAWMTRCSDYSDGYLAIGGLDNILCEMETQYTDYPPEDEPYLTGWHSAINTMRERLQKSIPTDVVRRPE